MIVVSLGTYTLLCIAVGLFLGFIFGFVTASKAQPKQKDEWQVIPSGTYVVVNGKVRMIEELLND